MACGNGANQIHHQRVKHQLCVTSTLPRALFGAYLPCLINILDLTSWSLLLPAGYRNCVQHNSHHPMYTGACGIGNLQGIANLRVITHLEMTISGCPLLWTSCNKLIKILGLKASCKKSSLFTKCPFLSESATRGLSQLVCGFGLWFLLCGWPKRKFELSRWRFVILASWT